MPEQIPATDVTYPVGNGQFGYEEAELSLKDIYYVLRRNARTIFWLTFIVFAITVLITLLATPVYESTAMIMVEEPSKSMTIFDLGMGKDLNLIYNEMEILKSRSLVEAVVNKLWQSEHRNNLFLFGTRLYQPEGIRKIFRQILTFGIWSPDTSDLPRYTETIDDSVFNEAVKTLRENMEVNNQRNTNILNVTVPSTDPDEAALITNTIVNLYQQRDMEVNAGEVINLKQFLEEQSAKVQADLARVEDSLQAFQEREQIYGLEGNADLLLEQLTEIESRYYTTLAEMNIMKERKRYVISRLTEDEKTLAEQLVNSINARVLALRLEISQAEADLVRNAAMYGEQHDLVISTREKIRKLKKELEEQTKTLISQGMAVADPIKYRQALIDTVLIFEGQQAGLEFKASEYKKLVDQYNAELNKLPSKSLQYARLERDRQVLADTYTLMRQKLEEARIAQASQLGKVRIIDPAIPPDHREKPKTKLNLALGLLLGLGLGVGGAFFLEYLDNTIRSVEDIERKGLTVLGIIPSISDERYQRRYRRKKGKTKAGENDNDGAGGNGKSLIRREVKRLQRRMITHEDPKSPISEAYRSLRTSIIYSTADQKIKSLLISSPGPGEGKTTTVANLAITYANLGKKTLLIDSDLRRPVIHRIFNLPRDPGITSYLSGARDDFDKLIQKTEVDNLFVVTSGIVPPNPSELLGSQRMSDLTARLEKEWDMVLFDSPPLVAVTDATMISKEIDRIIMVVKSGGTDKKAFEHTLQALENVKAPFGGVVLNAVTSKNSYGSYYYYYQYYHYYGDSK